MDMVNGLQRRPQRPGQTGDSFFFRFELGLQGFLPKGQDKRWSLTLKAPRDSEKGIAGQDVLEEGVSTEEGDNEKGIAEQDVLEEGGVREQSYDVKGP